MDTSKEKSSRPLQAPASPRIEASANRVFLILGALGQGNRFAWQSSCGRDIKDPKTACLFGQSISRFYNTVSTYLSWSRIWARRQHSCP